MLLLCIYAVAVYESKNCVNRIQRSSSLLIGNANVRYYLENLCRHRHAYAGNYEHKQCDDDALLQYYYTRQ